MFILFLLLVKRALTLDPIENRGLLARLSQPPNQGFFSLFDILTFRQFIEKREKALVAKLELSNYISSKWFSQSAYIHSIIAEFHAEINSVYDRFFCNSKSQS